MRNLISRLEHPGRSFAGAVLVAALCIACLHVTGCKSTEKPESAQFASVEIQGHTVEQIRSVTADVFHQHGYKAATGNLSSLVFEKEGSTMNNIAYGNWMGTGIANRAKINFVLLTGDAFRIECHAFLVRNKGEVLEEEIPVKGIHSGVYQKMLNEIAKRLNQS